MSREYRPGTCNIGSAERQRRFRIGWVSFLVAAVYTVVAVMSSWPRWTLLLAVVPWFGGFLGYLQGRRAFCIGFAMRGVYNVGDAVGTETPVEDPEAVQADRREARRLTVVAVVAATVVTGLIYVLAPA